MANVTQLDIPKVNIISGAAEKFNAGDSISGVTVIRTKNKKNSPPIGQSFEFELSGSNSDGQSISYSLKVTTITNQFGDPGTSITVSGDDGQQTYSGVGAGRDEGTFMGLVSSNNKVYLCNLAMGSELGFFDINFDPEDGVFGKATFLRDFEPRKLEYASAGIVLSITFDIDVDNTPAPTPDNPYAPGGTSGTGGGGGDFDTSSDPVDFPNLPALSASRCGLITMFNPTVSELQQLSTKMWSKDFLDNLTRLISDPIDIIVALTIVPVTPPVSGREEVIAGLLSTGVSMNVISSQYIKYECGTYKVTNFYDAALDYAPYTKVSIYLPYIGVRQLNVDEIMGAELSIQYNIDLFTGACVAMIKVNNAVMYSFDGNVATQIPVSAANYSSLYSSLIQGVASIATTAVTGGATAPMLAAQAASFAANTVTSAKPAIQRAGGITGANGLMGIQTPFLIFEIPRQSLPENQQVYTGYPSNITYKLADLSGFTQISDVHLDGIPATAQELTEIERLLKEGVII